MLKEHHITLFKSHGTLAARILLGGFFLIAGVSKLMDVEGTTSYMVDAGGLPEISLLALIVGLFETILGAALIVGKKFRESALLLAAYVLVVTFLFHGSSTWEANPIQQTLFYKNLAIIAGLLYMVAFGPGDGWRLKENHTATHQV